MALEPRLAFESIAGQRPYQEDSVLARNLTDGRLLVSVADGMGRHAAGEFAVHERAREPDKKGMGTTLTAVLVDDGEYFVANVGDSRGYLLTGEGIRQVTAGHSFVAEAMKRGQTREEAMATPWRDALTRSIGTEPHVEVDVFGPFPVRDDSALLICSDGLYKTLSDDDLQRIFLGAETVDVAAQTLVREALDSGSDDNISVAIAEFGEVPRASAQATRPIDFEPPAGADPGSVTTPEPDAGDETVLDLPSVEPSAAAGTSPTPAGRDAPMTDPVGPSVGLILALVAAVVVLVALLTL